MTKLQILKLLEELIKDSSVLKAKYNKKDEDYSDTIDRDSILSLIRYEKVANCKC
jgi:hypothetical protein